LSLNVFPASSLPMSNIARELVGTEHDIGVCLLFVDAPPGSGPSLHKHPYEEIFIVQEGEGMFVAGENERMVRGGEVLIVPAGVPHKFVNSGDGPLRQIDIHVSPRFITDWLE
jgi:mannose-6-phosphate isomerase-like protein (cupin superfamily)